MDNVFQIPLLIVNVPGISVMAFVVAMPLPLVCVAGFQQTNHLLISLQLDPS